MVAVKQAENCVSRMAMYIFLCLTLGLAPYNPPHLWEKLVMLKNGTLKRPVDWFDLFMHATPWFMLFLKWTTTWPVSQ